MTQLEYKLDYSSTQCLFFLLNLQSKFTEHVLIRYFKLVSCKLFIGPKIFKGFIEVSERKKTGTKSFFYEVYFTDAFLEMLLVLTNK